MVTSGTHEEAEEEDQEKSHSGHVTQGGYPSYPESVTLETMQSYPERATEMRKPRYSKHITQGSYSESFNRESKLSNPEHITLESHPNYSRDGIQGSKLNQPNYSEYFNRDGSCSINGEATCNDYIAHSTKDDDRDRGECGIVCVQCHASDMPEGYSASLERSWPRSCPCVCHAAEVLPDGTHVSLENAQSRVRRHGDNPSDTGLAEPSTSSRASECLEHEPSYSCPASLNWAPEPSGNGATGKDLTLREYVEQLEQIRKPQGNAGDSEQRNHRRNCIILVVFIICINVTIGLIRGLGGLPGITDE